MESILHIISGLPLEKIIFYLSGFICHQDKSILFTIGSYFLPLCPRCIGLHTGFFVTWLFSGLFPHKLKNLSRQPNLFILIFIISLTGIHWYLGFRGYLTTDFISRILTGFISGAALGLFLDSMKNKFPNHKAISLTKGKIFFILIIISFLIIFFNIYQTLLLIILAIVAGNFISIIKYLSLVIYELTMNKYLKSPRRCNYENT